MAAVIVDITNKARVDAMYSDIKERFDHVDILINNAAAFGGERLPFKDIKDTND